MCTRDPASLSYQVHRVNGDLAVSRGFGDAEYVDGKSERARERERKRERARERKREREKKEKEEPLTLRSPPCVLCAVCDVYHR